MAELVVGDVFDTPKMPVVTYDYTQKSEKYGRFDIIPFTESVFEPEIHSLLKEWATTQQSSKVNTLFNNTLVVIGCKNYFLDFHPEYVYLFRDAKREDWNGTSRFYLVFLEFPIQQKGYQLISLCPVLGKKDTTKMVIINQRWWNGRYGTSVGVSDINGQMRVDIGNVTPATTTYVTVIYPINGVIMTILDEEGNPIPEFTDPPPTFLTIQQYNNKLVLMGVDMMNAKREEWEQKLKMIEFHRQQMVSSTSYAYSTQLSLVRNAQAEEQRSLLNARGEAIYNLELLRQNELSRLNGQCDNAVKLVEAKKNVLSEEYEAACKQAYINKKQRDRGDNQKQSAKGKGGGVAESSKKNIFVDYQQQLNEILRDYNAKLDEVTSEITAVRQEYEVMRQEKVQEYSLIVSDLTMQYNQSCLDSARRYENQIFSITLQMESALFNLNLEYDQLRDAETMYFRHYETEMLAYFEDLKLIELEV